MYHITDQTMTMPSSEPEIRNESSRENFKQVTGVACARQVLSNFPVETYKLPQYSQAGKYMTPQNRKKEYWPAPNRAVQNIGQNDRCVVYMVASL